MKNLAFYVCFIGALLCLVSCSKTRLNENSQSNLHVAPTSYPSLVWEMIIRYEDSQPFHWIPPQPPDDEYFAVIESSVSHDIDVAKHKAVQNAKAGLALEIEAAITRLVKNFEEEVGGDASTAEATDTFAQISRSVADQLLAGTGNIKTHRRLNSDETTTTVYAFIEVPKENVEANLVDTIRANEAAYNRWCAAESFKELEHAIKEKHDREAQQE